MNNDDFDLTLSALPDEALNPKQAARRRWLQSMAALSASGLIPSLAMTNAMAAQTSNGYRALVCVFLFGGNDSNNMIVPITTTAYNAYAAARAAQASGGLALTQASLLPLPVGGNAPLYGFHPAMTGLQGLWNSGKLAPLFNVGTLIKPATKANYQTIGAAPTNLFSHQDQQVQMQGIRLNGVLAPSGWGGRMADKLGAASGGLAPVGISISGNPMYLTGDISSYVTLPSTGSLVINGLSDTSAAGIARKNALLQLMQSNDAVMISTLGGIQNSTVSLTNTLGPVLSGATSSNITTAFTGLTSSLSNQLKQVAKLIENRAQLGNPSRQIFFVSLGGFDTHTNQIATQNNLLTDVSASLTAFYNATVALGVPDKVTSFTLSDFTRTFKPASGAGSDHAWGGHHLIIGDAVNGQATYGTFPNQTIGGPDDVSTEGRWLPSTALDQYGATLGKWMGLDATELAAAFPNLNNFSVKDVGFMKP